MLLNWFRFLLLLYFAGDCSRGLNRSVLRQVSRSRGDSFRNLSDSLLDGAQNSIGRTDGLSFLLFWCGFGLRGFGSGSRCRFGLGLLGTSRGSINVVDITHWV